MSRFVDVRPYEPIEMFFDEVVTTDDVPNARILVKQLVPHEEQLMRFDEVMLQDLISQNLPLKRVSTKIIQSHTEDVVNDAIRSLSAASAAAAAAADITND